MKEEPPAGSSINLQFRRQCRSDEQTAEDSGSKQVASSAQLCEDRVKVSAGNTDFQLNGLLSPSGALLRPGALEAGLGTQARDEKDGNNIDRYNFSAEKPGEDKAFAAALVDQDPTAAALLDNECSTACGAHVVKKKKSEASHVSGSQERETSEQLVLPPV
ncbi:hypothetical protein E2562_003028 [Oryza meyeriana var. granulata]|uniref:Uncharacterized protein n=1 Tax=Oryza meyeriana var. granulata TaxID=110450 RepID=A0A6G1DFT1_9ORYZ|nr:hypothetical protein E2562_003028 [Oryza meyeriana var. granulata]